MKPALRRFGEGRHPVVVVDDFTGDVGAIVEIAAALAPFPAIAGSHYPGLRRTITEANVDRFVDCARPSAATARGYIHGSDAFYEQIGLVEGVADRLVIYRGSLLHSGIIPPDAELSADPRRGRLTANLFVQGR